MDFEGLKAALLNLDEVEQRRLVLEILPLIWSKIAADDSCLSLLRNLLDEESVRIYQQEHLDHIKLSSNYAVN